MPKYSHDINDLPTEEEIKKMWNEAGREVERVFLSLAWLTGARPMEILILTTDNITYDEDKFKVDLFTLKLKDSTDFRGLKQRTLEFERPKGVKSNIYIETIIKYLRTIPQGSRVVEYSKRWAEVLINRLGMQVCNKKFSPYHLRHAAITREAGRGVTIDGLMHFKGARSVRSVQPYLHARPYIIKE